MVRVINVSQLERSGITIYDVDVADWFGTSQPKDEELRVIEETWKPTKVQFGKEPKKLERS